MINYGSMSILGSTLTRSDGLARYTRQVTGPGDDDTLEARMAGAVGSGWELTAFGTTFDVRRRDGDLLVSYGDSGDHLQLSSVDTPEDVNVTTIRGGTSIGECP